MPTTVRASQSNDLSSDTSDYRSVLVISVVLGSAGPWMMGAAASAFYINDAASILPKAIVGKARTYLAGAYADVLEV